MSLAYSSTLKMEATCSSEMPIHFHLTARHYISEDRTLQFILFLQGLATIYPQAPLCPVSFVNGIVVFHSCHIPTWEGTFTSWRNTTWPIVKFRLVHNFCRSTQLVVYVGPITSSRRVGILCNSGN
jgi:hypothetical protein